MIAHRALGQLLLRLDDTDGAIRHLELAAAMAASDGPVQAALAEVYMPQGDTTRAVAARGKTRQFSDSLVSQDTWRAEVGTLMMTAALFERGARDQALALDAKQPNLLAGLGRALELNGQIAEAAEQ